MKGEMMKNNKAITDPFCYKCDYYDDNDNGYCYMFKEKPSNIPCAQYIYIKERIHEKE
jgi:hypothetical protein